MQTHDLVAVYRDKSDEELLTLAQESQQLTPEANAALKGELSRRRMSPAQKISAPEDKQESTQSASPEVRRLADSQTVTSFVAAVLSLYHKHFWLFVGIMAPAVLVGYIAVVSSGHAGREIARQLPRGFGFADHFGQILEIWFLNLAGYLTSWMALSFSFGATCTALGETAVGRMPSVRGCFIHLRERIGSILGVSLLLFVLLLVALAAAGLLALSILWILRQVEYRPSIFAIQGFSFSCVTLALLIFSRLWLAVPAVVFDNCGMWQAIFRSDEVTEGKWGILAILLVKSVLGGYIAGKIPFWLMVQIWPYVQLPWWVPTVASIAAVTIIEPFMFIGFGLLYLQMSALPPVLVDQAVPRLA